MLAFVLRQAFRKGLLGGNRRWLMVGGVAVGIKVLRKLGGNEPEVVYSERLSPGESLVIAHERDATMKG